MLIASLVVIIGLAGLAIYLIAKDPKRAEVGRIMFMAAAFAICFQFAPRLIVLMGR